MYSRVLQKSYHNGDHHNKQAAHTPHTKSASQSHDGVPNRMTLKGVAKGNGVDKSSDYGDGGADTGSSTRSFILLGLIFLMALVGLLVVYRSFPKLDEDEYQYIKVPRSLEDAKNLARVLSRYKDKYFYQVLLAFFVTYIFLQTFAIPGSIFLSIISGFLYPFLLALPLVCLCSGIGASLCYLLSFMISHRLVEKYIPERIAQWQQQVDHHRDHLLNYILFLRITPFLPNWFINIVSPVINVPLLPFFIGTVLGVGPPSFVMIQAGTTLHKLTSYGEPFTWSYFGLLAVFAVLSLLPVVFKERLKKKLE
ncbi:transmembrane protein 41B-like isoform X2 [Babylonia areolata]|uniref:transmembrane protein 41B-like isoform X2 n=1 Tax=Babylonia areolata TaxID=304850 RepID=UPI003FD4E389